MRLYLDDDLAYPLLAKLLGNAGHDVRLPITLGLRGSYDPVHLKYAIREQRSLLSGNDRDFRFLHELLREAQGHHPGILIVRRDNNPKRDLDEGGIVRAIRKLLAAAIPLEDQLHILNHWR